MRPPLSSPHVHSEYCDARSTAEEMVASAIRKGFVSLGISSHAVQDFDPPHRIEPGKEDAYIATVRGLQRRHAGRIRLWLGIERDALSPADRTRYDYVIGSVHYLPKGTHRVSVDGSPERLREDLLRWYDGSGAAFAEDYYEALGSYVCGYRPDIIGHFDLLMKNNWRHELFDPEDPRVTLAAGRALERCRQGCALMEVNTGALRRSGALAPYPALPLLRRWRALGGKVILSSDCHQAEAIDFGYEQGLRLMREAGFDSMEMLGRGDELFETVSLSE